MPTISIKTKSKGLHGILFLLVQNLKQMFVLSLGRQCKIIEGMRNQGESLSWRNASTKCRHSKTTTPRPSLSVYFHVCLSVCLSICLPDSLWICLSISVFLSVQLPVCVSVCPSMCMSFSLPDSLLTCLYICISVQLPVCLSVCPFLHVLLSV